MRQVHHLVQGSPEWKAHRATPGMINGSEIAAIMGIDPKTSRSELLRMKALGGEKEFSDYVQKRVIDKGHENESLARPMAEEIIGDDLSPLVMTDTIDGLLFSVSLDGITQCKSTTHEHKSLNMMLADALDAGMLPEEYEPQCEAGLMVSGATRCLFMATKDGDRETARHYWYTSKPELRLRMVAACRQFDEDRKNYVHVEQPVAAVAEPVEALPVLSIQVNGQIALTHNLERFGKRMNEYIAGLPTKPETDQDFANLDKAVKELKKAEEALDSEETRALSQTSAIADMRNLVAMYRETARTNRLMFEKLVKSEKENRKAAIVTNARQAIDKHVDQLNERIGGRWMPPASAQPYVDAIYGKKSLALMQDAVDAALAQAKLDANAIADTIDANRSAVPDEMLGLLFPDFGSVCTKSRSDFANLLAVRVAAHREAEEKRLEAERERIRQEESERIEREAAAKLTANNQTQFEAAALDQAATGTGVLKVSSEGVEHVPVERFMEAKPASAVCEQHTDAAVLDDFMRLLPISTTEKAGIRGYILKWEKYRVAREMQVAADRQAIYGNAP